MKGYKIYSVKSQKYKHRAGGILWSRVGDIYFDLEQCKKIVKRERNYSNKYNLDKDYEIHEFDIEFNNITNY